MTPGFIALLDLSTSADDRADAVARLDAERPAVEAMDGCIGCRIFTCRHDETAITVVHEWIDQESFDCYLASPMFARSSEAVRPLMTTPPVSRRFRVDLIETVA